MSGRHNMSCAGSSGVLGVELRLLLSGFSGWFCHVWAVGMFLVFGDKRKRKKYWMF
jgi:hypothetical protein